MDDSQLCTLRDALFVWLLCDLAIVDFLVPRHPPFSEPTTFGSKSDEFSEKRWSNARCVCSDGSNQLYWYASLLVRHTLQPDSTHWTMRDTRLCGPLRAANSRKVSNSY